MREPEWILDQVIYAIHSEQLAEHGGHEGVRDIGLLQSALDAPRNVFYYEKKELFHLAAVYDYRISNNQPFFDGNKRTGYIASRLFLLLNGYDIRSSETERVQIFLDISRNEKSEIDLAKWVAQHSIAVKSK